MNAGCEMLLAGDLANGLPSNGGGHEAVDAAAWSSEAKFLMLLSAPACVQLCTQQGLVVTNQVRRRQHLRFADAPACHPRRIAVACWERPISRPRTVVVTCMARFIRALLIDLDFTMTRVTLAANRSWCMLHVLRADVHLF